jgi:SNF2 family DNA or RNA helicase
VISLSVADDRLVFEAPAILKDLMRQIPGMRWHRQTNTWRAPLSWATALAARNILGDKLVLTPTALGWGRQERARVETSALIKGQPWGDEGYGFQTVGIDWLHFVEQGVLADEPGLGKTRQAVMALIAPALIICTNSTKLNWKKEIEQWRPELSVTVLDGSSTRRAKQLTGDSSVFVVNWESIRTLSRLAPYGSTALSEKEKTPGPLNRPWGTVIADEAHAAKDPAAKQTRAYWAIMSSARRRYALTGTLAPESPENVWAIMHGLCPAEYPSRTQFIDRYCTTVHAFWGGIEILGLNPETKQEFLAFFDPRFLRRTKAEALPWLPEKRYSVRYLDMEPKQRKAYDTLESKFLADVDGGVIATTNDLTQHVRLLQSASATPTTDDAGNVGLSVPSNKVNALLDLISESPNEPLAVFSPSKKLILLASEYLGKAKVTFALITGDQSTVERQKAVDDFQSGAVQVILGTTQAGGIGITLHRAQRLVFLSRPEAAVQSIQTEDRVHRIGQTGAVEIIDFISADTLEQDLHEALGAKGDLAQEINRDPMYLRRLVQNRHNPVLS